MTLPPPTHDGFRPTQCRHTVRLAWVRDDPGAGRREIGFADVRCKCWGCEGCGRWLRQLHCQLIEASYPFHTAQGHPFPRFLTITWPTDTGALVSSAADCANTSDTFRRFVRKVRRYYKPRLSYYVVKEATKRGRLHLHAITWGPYIVKCRRNLPGHCVLGCGPDCKDPCHRPGGCRHRGLKARRPRPCFGAIAHSVGMGWIDAKKVRGGGAGAARYISKYLGKQHIGQPWPRYSRRVSYSRGFAPTTIGRLAAAWSERAYRAGVEAGHIIPTPFPAPEYTRWRLLADLRRRGPPAAWLGWLPGEGWALDLEAGTVRHLGSTQTADLDTGEVIERPWVDLTETAWLRRMGRNVDEHAAEIAGAGWLTDPVFTEDASLRRLILAEAHRRAYVEAGMANVFAAVAPHRPALGP